MHDTMNKRGTKANLHQVATPKVKDVIVRNRKRGSARIELTMNQDAPKRRKGPSGMAVTTNLMASPKGKGSAEAAAAAASVRKGANSAVFTPKGKKMNIKDFFWQARGTRQKIKID